MKALLFKALGYLATSGVAATSVLLTASSVGLKKTVKETNPNLEDLVEERPDLLEELMKPVIPPPPPPEPPPSGEKGEEKDEEKKDEKKEDGEADQKQEGDSDQGDDTGQDGQGSALYGMGGTIIETCTSLEESSEAITTILEHITDYLSGMESKVQGVYNCLGTIAQQKLSSGVVKLPSTTDSSGDEAN